MTDEVSDDGIDDSSTIDRLSIDDRFDFRLPDATAKDASPPSQSHDPLQDLTTLSGRAPQSLDEADPVVGQTIGNYEVQRELGRGGFGTVYQALDQKLDRPAALKFLRFPLDRQYRELFIQEAKVIANLSKHPSIVQIYEWGEHQGSYFFALEYLDMSAEKLLEDAHGPIPVTQALRIIESCAAGLEYAHEQGVLHRDIKPANILLDRKSERAKLCDFGLAKFQSLGSGTHVSTLAGSPPYMAPEQVAGGKISARTDIYALGVTLYELLSGRLPCEGSAHAEILEKISKGNHTPLTKHRPDLPQAIQDLVNKTTAFRPENRYQHAAELRKDVVTILQTLESSGSAELAIQPRKPGVPARALKVAAALAASAAIVLLGWRATFAPGNDAGDSSVLWPAALASVKTNVDSGAYEEAERALTEHLSSDPDDAWAQFAMGYVQLKTDRLLEASSTFGSIPAQEFREEGLAALAHQRDGESARDTLERAAGIVTTGYPSVLLAALDIAQGEYRAAVARLEELNRATLLFEWQRREFSRMLGQAYYKTGDRHAAEEALLRLPDGDAFAAGYLELARRDEERTARTALNEQIDDVAEMWDAMGIEGRQDTWSSRPFSIELAEAGDELTPLSISLGLPDLLPIGLTNAGRARSDIPLSFVNREDIEHILQELRTSGMLSAESDGLQGRRFIGARLLMQARYIRPANGDLVEIAVTDVETSLRVVQTVFEYDDAFDHDRLAVAIVERLVQALRDQYPIQGLLNNDGGVPKINVGTLAGIQPGMEFDVRPTKRAAPIPDIRAVATQEVGDAETALRLVDMELNQIPENGFFLREIRTQ